MNIIICVDDHGGMIFNHRRQSQDEELRKHILSTINIVNGNRLWMNVYSSKQFEAEDNSNICVDNDFLNKAEENDYCFVENVDIEPFMEKIKAIILFRWNRKYPADRFFNLQAFTTRGWEMLMYCNFEGKSHEKITEEVYIHA